MTLFSHKPTCPEGETIWRHVTPNWKSDELIEFEFNFWKHEHGAVRYHGYVSYYTICSSRRRYRISWNWRFGPLASETRNGLLCVDINLTHEHASSQRRGHLVLNTLFSFRILKFSRLLPGHFSQISFENYIDVRLLSHIKQIVLLN